MTRQKYLLISLIVISYLPIVLFQNYSSLAGGEQFFDFGFWGRFLGMIGIVTLMWQYLLGIKRLVSRVIPDLFWVNKVHRFLGTYVITLFLLHPFLITVFYLANGTEVTKLISLSTEFDRLKFVGVVAFSILLVTWILSALVRGRLSFKTWKLIHMLNYFVLPLALVHSIGIGEDFIFEGPLTYYWWAIASIYFLGLIYKVLTQIGVTSVHYRLQEKQVISTDGNTIKLDFTPTGDRMLKPQNGQFIYIRPLKGASDWHPFTVSHHNHKTGQITLSVRVVGKFTQLLKDMEIGREVLIDGPFGVFTSEVMEKEKPIVLIAGGIGITPFIWILRRLAKGWDRQVTLFYGNKSQDTVAYVESIQKLSSLPNFQVIHVMSEQEDFDGEKGYITAELISTYIKTESAYFLSGPPKMVKSILLDAQQSSTIKGNLSFELFEL